MFKRDKIAIIGPVRMDSRATVSEELEAQQCQSDLLAIEN